jgi:methionine synthase II (cobalamin-independent)
VAFLRTNTDRRIKITVPGAFTMAQQAQNDFYKDEIELAMDYAAAVNEEIKDLFAAGADVIQIDEPYMQRASRTEQQMTDEERFSLRSEIPWRLSYNSMKSRTMIRPDQVGPILHSCKDNDPSLRSGQRTILGEGSRRGSRGFRRCGGRGG